MSDEDKSKKAVEDRVNQQLAEVYGIDEQEDAEEDVELKKETNVFQEKFGPITIKFNPMTISIGMKMAIGKILAEERVKNSGVLDYPANVGENPVDWQLRTAGFVNNINMVRKKDQALKDWALQVYMPDFAAEKMGLNIINRVSKLLNGDDAPQIKPDDYYNSNLDDTRAFIQRIFESARIYAEEYVTKR